MPPTGKKCNRGEATEDDGEMAVNEGMMALLVEIRNKVDSMDEKVDGVDGRVRSLEEEKRSNTSEQRSERAASIQEIDEDYQETGMELTPTVLRNDVRAMRRAAERIAWLQMDDEDDDGAAAMPIGRRNGKKSGSAMVAADTVKKRIDWPHLYVKRRVAGVRVPVRYEDLRIDEFVYGFLIMLKSEKFAGDKDNMLEVLGMLMEDSMDYTWSNARGFYYMLGLDVEQGTRSWSDRAAIQEMRLLQSRAVFPESKEAPSSVKKTTPTKPNSTSTKCCALYQQKTCEHNRDHPPFAHACAFCARITGNFYKHPEQECFRKSLEETKNGKKRE